MTKMDEKRVSLTCPPLNCTLCPYRDKAMAEAFRAGRLSIHDYVVMWDGKTVRLTRGEYDIVHKLAFAEGMLMTYLQIHETQHYVGFRSGEGAFGWRNNVRCMIKKIRRKFEAVDPNFNAIQNLVGVGYRFVLN